VRSALEFAAAAGLLTLLPGPDSLLTLRMALAQGRTQGICAAAGICTALAGWGCAAAAGLTAALAASPALYDSLRWAGAAYLAYLGYRALTTGSAWDGDTVCRAQSADAQATDAHTSVAQVTEARVAAGRVIGARAADARAADAQAADARATDSCRAADPATPRGDRAARTPRRPSCPAADAQAADGRRLVQRRGRRRRAYLRGVLTDATNPKIGIFYLSLFPLFIPRGTPVLAFGLLLTPIHVAESISWLVLVAIVAGRIGHVFRRRSARRWADRVSGAAFLAFAARLAAGG
jgi:threonine/homoserine/homoserine lactone efflux protein